MTNQNKAIIISHNADPDGFVSAALIADMLEGKGIKYEIRLTDYPILTETITKVAGEVGKIIYIMDLALRPSVVSDELLERLLSHNEVHYFDHHKIEDERKELFTRRVKTYVHKIARICTAHLILDYFQMKGVEHKVLAECAQAVDYGKASSEELTKLGVSLGRSLLPESDLKHLEIMAILIQGLKDPTLWREDYQLTGVLKKGELKSNKAIDDAILKLERTASVHKITVNNNTSLVLVFALVPTCLYMKAGYYELKKKYPEADFCFALYESVSTFGGVGHALKNTNLSILPFLEARGGGGRNNMGGFVFPTVTDSSSFEERKNQLLKDLEGYFNNFC
ncbi:MAG: hypothetical protein ABII18_10090 [bacterium]